MPPIHGRGSSNGRPAAAPAAVILAALLLTLTGCSSSSSDEHVAAGGGATAGEHVLPDRSDPKVHAIEVEVAEAVGGYASNADDGPAGCEARLLLDDATGRGAWVRCSTGVSRSSYPVLIEPDGTVRVPQDGEGYPDDVREMFPAWLADRVLRQDPGLKP